MFCGDCKKSKVEHIPDCVGGYQGQGDYRQHIICLEKLPTQSECFRKGLLTKKEFSCPSFEAKLA